MAFFFTLLYVGISLLSPGVFPAEVAELHIVEILAVIVFLVAIPSFSGSKLTSTPEAALLVALIVSSSLSMATTWIGGIPITLASIVPPVFSFFLVVLSCRSLKRLRILVWVMLGVALFIFYQGVHAVSIGQIDSPWFIVEGPVSRTMGMGFLNDPNDLAQFYVTLIPLLFLRWNKGSSFSNLLFSVAPSLVLLVGIFDTHSRGGLLAIVGLTLFAFKDKVGKILSAVFAGVLMLAMTALNATGGRGINEDDGGRVELWSEGLTIFKSHPLLGVGVNNFGGFSSTGLTAHNTYILSLAELGLLGFFCWLGLLVFTMSGLAALIPRKKPAESTALPFAQIAEAPPEPQPEPALAMPGGFAFAAASYSPAPFHLAGASAGSGSPYLQDAPADEISDETFAGYARVIQAAFVGFLISAFFISRTYVMTLYILLGMSVALRNLYRDRHPEFKLDNGKLIKRTLLWMVGAIVFLYAFIRIKGV